MCHFAAVTQENKECISKHTKDATAFRGFYKFKSTEVSTITVTAGYATGVAGKAFLWEYQFVHGRQLATAELIESRRPDMWKQFCDSCFSGADRLQGNSGPLGYLSSQQPSAGLP
ncbi:TPA: hypothetical protein ACH3X1_009808 [Trebouxia sp. C0004]